MKKFWNGVKRFFTFPAGSSPGLRLLPYSIVVIILLAIAAGSVAGWEYTNSNTFCGTTCHTMPPQYSTYMRSPHARVACVECHLGRDLIANQIPRKFAHSHTLIALIFHTYEYPIIAKQMRPAREACETCHYPEKFSDDSLREVRYHLDDVSNTQESIFLLLKTGGGSSREGLGRGIHWHIEQKVEFLTLDPLEQKIPYIRVTTTDGKVIEYFDTDAEVTITPETKLKTVDCITCHNRTAHNILNPASAVDAAIEIQKISPQLPSIRAKAVQILVDAVKTPANLEAALSNLKNGYADQPADAVDQSIATIREIATQISYPEQKLDWTSHPDNIGHKDSPGCFRCHDGKHFSKTGEAVRLECNLCHSIPSQADPTKFTTNISIERGPEPNSHTHSSWIMLHGKMLDTSCATCHPPKDPSTDLAQLNGPPPPDGSFCGNALCHGYQWKFIAGESPALNAVIQEQLASIATPTPAISTPAAPEAGSTPNFSGAIQPILAKRCGACHTGANAMAGMDLSAYETLLKENAAGAGIVPNDPNASLIFTVQSAGGHFGQLTADELAILKAWIDAGAPQ